MTQLAAKAALQQYQTAGLHGEAEQASPHRLVLMLYNGALERIAAAKTYMTNNKLSNKGEAISRVILILGTLRHALHEDGGDISKNLDALYVYMEQRLVIANRDNNPMILDEVSVLINELKTAWQAIPQDVIDNYKPKDMD